MIDLTIEDNVAHVVLNAPKKLNSLDEAALDELAARDALALVPAGEFADLDPESAFLVNVNTADQLAAARARGGA